MFNHDQLCTKARVWLRGTRRCNPVFSNIASCSEIPDAIGWSTRHGSTVVECKTSRSDFYADKKKWWIWQHKEKNYWRLPPDRVSPNHPDFNEFYKVTVSSMGDYRFFLCEDDLITAEDVEKHAPDHGLLHIKGKIVKIIRQAPKRKDVDKDGEIRYLRFAVINKKEPHFSEEDFEDLEVRAVCV